MNYLEHKKKFFLSIPDLHIPRGYRKVSYLESTGTQIIDTKIYPNNNLTVLLDFAFVNYSTSGLSRMIGGYYENNNRYQILRQSTVAFVPQTMKYGNVAGTHNRDKNRHKIEYNDSAGNYKWDGSSKGSVYNSINPQYPSQYDIGIGLFGETQYDPSNNNYDKDSLVSIRIYGFKAYNKQNNDELYADFIPCLDTFGVPCFYDLIRHKTFYNKGTGEFIYGQIIS